MIGFLSGSDWLLPVFLPSFVFVQTGFVAVILFLFMRNDMNFTSTGHSFEPVLMASTGFYRVFLKWICGSSPVFFRHNEKMKRFHFDRVFLGSGKN